MARLPNVRVLRAVITFIITITYNTIKIAYIVNVRVQLLFVCNLLLTKAPRSLIHCALCISKAQCSVKLHCHSQDWGWVCFTYLLWAYLLTESELSSLAMLARPYPVSGPTYVPLIPSHVHCMSRYAHEVLAPILEVRLVSVFTQKINCFFRSSLRLCIYTCIVFCAAPGCY